MSKKKKTIPVFVTMLATGAMAVAANKIIGNNKGEKALEKAASALQGNNEADDDQAIEETEQFLNQNYAYLQLKNDPDGKYYITSSLNIGRYPHNDIQLQGRESGVSRTHCRIFVKGGKYYVVDQGASVKALLNGRAVDNEKPASADLHEFFDYELTDGAELTVGKYVFVFHANKSKDQKIAAAMDAADSTIVVD